MTSARAAIEHQLETDPFLRDALDRGIVNAKGLAEWLVEHRGLDHEPDTLAHHLRELQNQAGDSSVEAARQALSEVDVHTLSNRIAFVIPRADQIQQRLSRLIADLDIGSQDDVRLVTGERSVLLIVDDAGADQARSLLGDLGDNAVEELTELRLDPAKDAADPRSMGWVVEALAAQEIDVVAAFSGDSGAFVLLDEADRAQALKILTHADGV